MSSIILPSSWTSQPQETVEVAWGDSSAEQTQIAWIPAYRSSAPSGTLAPYSIVGEYENGGLRLNTSTSVIVFRLPVAYGVHYLNNTAWSFVFEMRGSVSGYQSFATLQHESGGGISYIQRHGGASYIWSGPVFPGPETINNGVHTMDVVFGSIASAANGSQFPVSLFIDGRLLGTVNLNDYYNRTYVTFSLGAVRGTTATPDITVYGAFGRDAEFRLENPWQIFKSRKRVLYFDVSSFPALSSLTASYITSSGGRLTVST